MPYRIEFGLVGIALALAACRSQPQPLGGSESLDFSAGTLVDGGFPDLWRRRPIWFKAGSRFTGIGNIAVADLDSDGHQDLIFGDTHNAVVYLPGDGQGAFGPRRVIASLNSGQIQVGDLNNDGVPDVVLSTDGPGLAVVLGTGHGNFSSPIYSPGGSAIVLADFDTDGFLDAAVIVSKGGPNMSTLTSLQFMRGSGDGAFATHGSAIRLEGITWHVAHGDLDGDGRPDLVFTDGTFTAAVHVILGTTLWTAPIETSYSVPGIIGDLAVTDMNGDGHDDVMLANEAVSVMLARGDGSLMPLQQFPVPGNDPAGLTIADFDGDRLLDVAVATNNGFLYALRGERGGSLHAPFEVLAFDGVRQRIVSSDFNEDGRPDLAITTSYTVMSFLNGPQ